MSFSSSLKQLRLSHNLLLGVKETPYAIKNNLLFCSGTI